MILRDPIHGDITLTGAEAALLDSPAVQRLRGIKQTGTAYLVYPGCTHTRFDHSLGTMAVARRIVASLRENGFPVSADEEAVVCLAALAHDVTHVPFGHTLEDERQIFPRHDDGHRLPYFMAGPLGAALDAAGARAAVEAMLRAKGDGASDGAVQPWQAEVVISTVSADLLDYLRRDSYFAGLTQNYDDRIFRYFILEDGHLVLNLVKDAGDRPDARSEIMHLLRMRYFLTERIYTHHAKITAGAMISKAVEMALSRGFTEEDLYRLSDHSLLEQLARFPAKKPDAAIAALAEGVLYRRLHKRAYVLSPYSLTREERYEIFHRYGGQARDREVLEESIRAMAGLRPGEVIVYCPKPSLFKEVNVPVKSRLGVRPLKDLGPLLAGEAQEMARQYEDLWRFYAFCPAQHAERVRAACEGLLGLPSELRREA